MIKYAKVSISNEQERIFSTTKTATNSIATVPTIKVTEVTPRTITVVVNAAAAKTQATTVPIIATAAATTQHVASGTTALTSPTQAATKATRTT